MTPLSLLALCREGFETEVAKELLFVGTKHNLTGYAATKPGWVRIQFNESPQFMSGFLQELSYLKRIFTRHIYVHLADCINLSAEDRITPIFESAKQSIAVFMQNFQNPIAISKITTEHPDTNETRELSDFCKKIGYLIDKEFRASGLVTDVGTGQIHVLFVNYETAFVGFSVDSMRSRWTSGMCRIRMPKDSPSRSVVKLEEAIKSLLPASVREEYVRAGQIAVDLGAAPGGWTYLLLKHDMQVFAVDNANLHPSIVKNELCVHCREDGFSFEPKTKPVTWMLCDMVDAPLAVTKLVTKWFNKGWCRGAIFNLKLPMKKRWNEVQLCLGFMEKHMTSFHDLEITCKHLYHDREEVTFVIYPKVRKS